MGIVGGVRRRGVVVVQVVGRRRFVKRFARGFQRILAVVVGEQRGRVRFAGFGFRLFGGHVRVVRARRGRQRGGRIVEARFDLRLEPGDAATDLVFRMAQRFAGFAEAA